MTRCSGWQEADPGSGRALVRCDGDGVRFFLNARWRFCFSLCGGCAHRAAEQEEIEEISREEFVVGRVMLS